MTFSHATWNLLYRHFFPRPEEPKDPFDNYNRDETVEEWIKWRKPIKAAEAKWERTRLQRKKEGWSPNPAKLAKLRLYGLGERGKKEIRMYLEQHGLTFEENLDTLLRKEQNLINMIESLKKALEETQRRIRNCKGN